MVRAALLLSSAWIAAAIPILPVEAQAPADHTRFTELLQEVVEFPRVDYQEVLRHRGILDAYMEELAATDPDRLTREPEEVQLTFWINAYNACMLQIVADHYPIERGGVGLLQGARNLLASRPSNSVWWIRDVFDGPHCRVAQADRSLDEIEHEIIRPRFGEPRIHFAVNCAALSCPPLWPEAYEPDRLEEQLQRATENFMEDPEHFRIEEGSPPTLRVNRVLDWFGEDFGNEDGIKEFFAARVGGNQARILRNPETRVDYFDYDWTLNDVDP